MSQKSSKPFGLKDIVHFLDPTRGANLDRPKAIGKAVDKTAKTVWSGKTPPADHGGLGHEGLKQLPSGEWVHADQGPASSPAPAPDRTHTSAPSDTGRTKQVQQILRNHGYNIQVDGKAGPLTKSALENFHSSGGSAKTWNASNTAAPVAKPIGSRNTAGTGGTAPKIAKTPASSGDSSLKTILASLNDKSGLIDASKYTVDAAKTGAAQAGQVYDPQINQANRTISDATAQGKSNLLNLKKWFGDASDIAATGAATAHTMGQQDQAAQGKSSAAILSALGGSASGAAASVGNTAELGATQLAGRASATDAFDSMLKGLITSQGANAEMSQGNLDTKNIGDMKTALASLIASKAQAMTSDTSAAKQTNLSNLVGITNANNASQANNLNKTITMAELPNTLAASDQKVLQGDATYKHTQALTQATLLHMHNQGIIDQAQYEHLVAESAKLSRTSGPKSFFPSATPTDISNGKAAIIAAISAAKKANKNFAYPDAVKIAKATILPWNPATPGVNGVISSGLSLAGYPGYPSQ